MEHQLLASCLRESLIRQPAVADAVRAARADVAPSGGSGGNVGDDDGGAPQTLRAARAALLPVEAALCCVGAATTAASLLRADRHDGADAAPADWSALSAGAQAARWGALRAAAAAAAAVLWPRGSGFEVTPEQVGAL
eukprot:289127-Chlamydomonas_euryale.AAC.3